jgi:hypothetical protein
MDTKGTLVFFVSFVSVASLGADPPVPAVRNISYAEARPIVESLRPDLLPEELRAAAPHERESLWPGWVSRHDRAIRSRIEQGDRDSIVNFLLFGTSFTTRPRATGPDLAALKERGRNALLPFAGRIEDLAAGIASPGANERLQFARRFVEPLGSDPATAAGQNRLRAYLGDLLLETPAALDGYGRELDAARSAGDASAAVLQGTLFRNRGLSTDTSILIDFALDRTLDGMKAGTLVAAGSIARVGIVGPGLDFTDKHDGHDFYPLQTIQPFGIVDSLARLGLAARERFSVTTFDVSPRVIQHLDAARERARHGQPYALVLPRNLNLPWSRPLVSYWEQFGARIGSRGAPIAVPPNAGDVEVRSVAVDAGVVSAVVPQNVNIVLQRLAPLAEHERFDLIVATDVLVYYDVFEQSLALSNIAGMLRPGGFLLTNSRLFELPVIPIAAAGTTDVVHMTMPIVGEVRDRIFCYRRE